MRTRHLASLATRMTTILTLCLTINALPSPRTHPKIAPRTPPNLSTFTPPLSNGTTSLPPPTTTLKAIALGHGTQNYTCAPNPANNTTTPTPLLLGALATLYDTSPLLPLLPHPPASAIALLDTLPSYILSLAFEQMSTATLPVLGRHYFTAAGVPCFDLGDRGVLYAKKEVGGDIVAPAGESVDWLKLGDEGGSEGGLGGVYRVETVGGKVRGGCGGVEGEGGGEVIVEYAALYWFYASE